MSADNRSVTTDALHTLGTIITASEKRDAIHLAVENVVAAHRLKAGDHVGLDEYGRATYLGTNELKMVGIVDPFVETSVLPGQHFWLVVYPRQITSLRHVWEHPDFQPSEFQNQNAQVQQPAPAPAVPSGLTSDQMIEIYLELRERARHIIQTEADAAGLTFQEMVDAAENYAESGDWMCEGGRWESHSVNSETFWPAYELWTGKFVKEEDRGGIFTCSC
jgi:hypothetical protein